MRSLPTRFRRVLRLSWAAARAPLWRVNTVVETSLEHRFDVRRETTTAGTQYLEPIDAAESGTLGYAGTRERELRFLLWMLRRRSGVQAFDEFVDVGAGMGKACIIAVESGIFQETVAVEFDEDLSKMAARNSEKSGAHFRVVHADARNVDAYLSRAQPLTRVFYLFNPFSVDVLDQFLDSLRQVPGRKYLIYNNEKDQLPLAVHGWSRLWHWKTPMLVGRRRNPMSIWTQSTGVASRDPEQR